MVSINKAASEWGFKFLRYEIINILPSAQVKAAMEMEAEAKRKKKTEILESEARGLAIINIVNARKSAVIIKSEATRRDRVNRAGEAEAVIAHARAISAGISLVWEALKEQGGAEAASLRVAERYVQTFNNTTKEMERVKSSFHPKK